MKVCRLITLDIMGTLIDISSPVGVSYSQTAVRYGLNISPHSLTKSFSKVWTDMKIRHPNYGLHTGLGWEKWWKTLVCETFTNSTNAPLDNQLLNAVSEELIKSYNHPDKWKYCDGALDFINHCHDNKIPLAVLSNFDDRLEDLLESMGMRKYFRFVVASYTVGFEKPDQRIFSVTENIAKTFDDLHDIKKNEILHIGDLPEFDYLPARKAGWYAYLVSKTADNILEKYPSISKENIFKSFHEVKRTFECTNNFTKMV